MKFDDIKESDIKFLKKFILFVQIALVVLIAGLGYSIYRINHLENNVTQDISDLRGIMAGNSSDIQGSISNVNDSVTNVCSAINGIPETSCN